MNVKAAKKLISADHLLLLFKATKDNIEMTIKFNKTLIISKHKNRRCSRQSDINQEVF